MSKITVWVCDKCKKEFREQGGLSEISFIVDSFLDAAGSKDTEHKYLDLCNECTNRFVASFLKNTSFEEQLKLAKLWGAR